jgi:hypothetical protein
LVGARWFPSWSLLFGKGTVDRIPYVGIDDGLVLSFIYATSVVYFPCIDHVGEETYDALVNGLPPCRMPRLDFRDFVLQPRRRNSATTGETEPCLRKSSKISRTRLPL